MYNDYLFSPIRYELSDFRLLCPRCYKCFETEKKSKAHKLACLTPATLKCPQCDEMFRFAQTLKSHMMKHTDERPLMCSWPGCDKTFKLKSSMTEHIRREHEKIEYKCPHCPKTYRYKSNFFKNCLI